MSSWAFKLGRYPYCSKDLPEFKRILVAQLPLPPERVCRSLKEQPKRQCPGCSRDVLKFKRVIEAYGVPTDKDIFRNSNEALKLRATPHLKEYSKVRER